MQMKGYDKMKQTLDEILQFVEENDVKFVKLAFCDIFGTQKNISILASQLEKAFTQGVAFDASGIDGFMNFEKNDLYLFPDASTLTFLPWRPQQGRVVRLYCDIRHADGSPFDGDCRAMLKNAVQFARKQGYSCHIGTECEFYLFEQDENGRPTTIPHDDAGYLDIAPFDRGENVRRDICMTLEDMGIVPETSHHEKGPGQSEIDFQHSDALTAADNLISFKSVVKSIANRNGLYASFMPKPLEGCSGSGLHINISMHKDGKNIFAAGNTENQGEAQSFVDGILSRIAELTAFLNPTTNSYKRLGENSAPKYITWSKGNLSQLLCIPCEDGARSRMELRSADSACNPYIAFALLIYAGLEGIESKAKLCAPVDNMDNLAASAKSLPSDLNSAIMLATGSDFIKKVLPPEIISTYLNAKYMEWQSETLAANPKSYELETYFNKL